VINYSKYWNKESLDEVIKELELIYNTNIIAYNLIGFNYENYK
jgi:hypothetical protein